MAKFKWDSKTISGNQILETLISQYGYTQPIAIDIADMSKQLQYSNTLVPVKCNRCGSSFSMSPKLICEAFDNRGYVCSNCGNLTMEQIRSKRKEQMLEGTVDLAREKGIDIDAIEEEKELQREEENSKVLTNDDVEFSNEELTDGDVADELDEISRTTESSSVVEVDDSDTDEDEDDISKYMSDGDDMASIGDITAKTIELDNDEDEINGSSDLDWNEFEDGSINDGPVVDVDPDPEDDVSTIIEDVTDENTESVESATPTADTIDKVFDLEKDEEVEAMINNVVEKAFEQESDKAKVDEVAASKQKENETEEEPGDYFMVGNKRMTPEDVQRECIATEKEVKKILGFWPYARKVVPENGALKLTCGICTKQFFVDDLSELKNKIVTLTKEYCVSRGLGFKAPYGKIAKLYYCPHCIQSVTLDGHNSYLRDTVDQLCKRIHLNIVNPEVYWYAGFEDAITVEANGVEQTLRIRDLFEKYDNVADARRLIEFRPQGNATKSSTDEETEKNSFTFSTAKTAKTENAKRSFSFENVGRPFNGTAVDSNAKLDEEARIDNASVEENTVFHINQKLKDEHSNIAKLSDRLNPFARAKSLESSFQKTPFAAFISDLSEETKLECTLIINSKTFEIPIIDFENGFRIICVNIDDNSMTKIPYNVVSTCVNFSYRGANGRPIENYKTIVLYSDSVRQRRDATMEALIKFINPNVLPYKNKRIVMEDTLFTQYTDYKQYLKEFDSQYSTFPAGKPKNGQLGIVATWAEDDNSKADFKSIMKFQMMVQEGNKTSLNQLNSDYSQYMVASIKYIERFNQTTGRYTYTITDYVEIGSAIIADGFLQCIRALLKEYKKNHPNMATVIPHIIVEIDPNVYPSPSLKSYIEKGTLRPMDDVYKALSDGKTYVTRHTKDQYLRFTYVRRLEYRSSSKDSDWSRQDMRMFGAGTLARTMAEELKQAGIATGITDDGTRNAFIHNMGFTKNNQLEVKEYFIDQTVTQSLLVDSKTAMMQKLPSPDEMFTKSGLVNSSADGFNINNVMSNPALMRKYMNIMQNGSPEAKNYFMNNVIYQNQMNPTMNGGMNINPGMMGMNPMMMGGMQGGMMPGMNPGMMGMGMGMPMMGNGFNPMMNRMN